MKKNYCYILCILLTLVVCFIILTRNNEVPTMDDYNYLYQQLIDELMKKNSIPNEKYLAVDIDSFTLLDESYKMSVLIHVYKYNNEVFPSTYQKLAEKGYFVNSGLEGGLIKSEIIKKNKKGNNIKIEISKYNGPLSLYGFTYKAIFKDGQWKLKKLDEFIS